MTASTLPTTANTYRERVALGKEVVRMLPFFFLFIPAVYLTAGLGCWKNSDKFDSWKLGDTEMSMWVNLFVTGVAFTLMTRTLIEFIIS